MRLSFANVVEARSNPAAFKLRMVGGLKGGPRRYGPNQFVIDAVLRMHKGAVRAQVARTTFLEELEVRFPGHAGLNRAIGRFDKYVASFEARNVQGCLTRVKVKIPLRPEAAANFAVTGQIMRVDMTAAGYEAWLFAISSTAQKQDARLALVHLAVAHSLGVTTDDVTAGVYSFADDSYQTLETSADELDVELEDLHSLLGELA